MDAAGRQQSAVCERCGGTVQVVAALTEPGAIRKYLQGVGLPTRAPPIAPAGRQPQQELSTTPPRLPEAVTADLKSTAGGRGSCAPQDGRQVPAVARRLIFTIDAIDHTQPGSQAHCGENNCSSAQYRPACCLDSITNTPFILTNREACQSLGIRHTRTKPVTHGPKVSSNACRARSFTSTGVRPFAGDTSLLVRSSTGLCNGTLLSITTIGRIKGTVREAGYHLTSSGESLTASPNRETEVSTPFRIWTA